MHPLETGAIYHLKIVYSMHYVISVMYKSACALVDISQMMMR